MPNRILREGILSSEPVDRVAGEPAVEVTYRRLISLADDFGRYSANPSLVRSGAYPLRPDMYSAEQISEHLRKCETAGLIRRYEADGKPFLEVLRFGLGQRLRAKRSKYPAPPGAVDGSADGEQPRDTCPSNVSRPLSESESEIERRETEARDAITIHWLRQSNRTASLADALRRTPQRSNKPLASTWGNSRTTTLSFKSSKPAAGRPQTTSAGT